MNLDKEKELFEIEFSKIKSDVAFWVNTWDEDMQGYNHPVMCWMWHIWQASANRDGYKFVPVEPTQKMVDKFPEVYYQDTYAGECSLWVDDETIKLGYKAMIGAAE